MASKTVLFQKVRLIISNLTNIRNSNYPLIRIGIFTK